MTLVDTHCHLADDAFLADVGEVVSRSRAAGVQHAVVIGETPERATQALELVDRWPGLSATAGLHPHEAKRWSPELAGQLRGLLADPRVVAVGELGLDYHYDHSPRPMQLEAFEGQMDLARAVGKPVVIHARNADDDVDAVLANHPGVTVVMHSFSSGERLLESMVARGAYLSFSGMITFKSWHLTEAMRGVPWDRLMVETDAPYLAPVPYRGKRNEPSYVAATARRLAEIMGTTPDEIATRTTDNAIRVFGSRLTTSYLPLGA